MAQEQAYEAPVIEFDPQGVSLVEAVRLVCGFLAISSTDSAVDADPVADRSPQQHVDWQAHRLARDIPEGVVEGGDRRQSHSARREAELLHQLHHDVLNAARIFAADELEQVVGDGLH